METAGEVIQTATRWLVVVAIALFVLAVAIGIWAAILGEPEAGLGFFTAVLAFLLYMLLWRRRNRRIDRLVAEMRQ